VSLGVVNSANFTNPPLAVGASATIEVRRESDSGLAAIYSDRAGTTPITNPSAFADSFGRFTFYAAASPGGFSILVTSGAQSYTLRNVPIGTAQEMDADPFWATVLATDNDAAARLALGFAASVDGEIAVGDGTDFVSIPVPMGFAILNGHLDWTVSGNALTVAIKTWAGADPSAGDPVYIAFRSATADTGLPLIRTLTAATSVVASSGSSLGTINSTAFRLWCVAFDDGGTVRLGLIQCLSGTAPNFSIYPLAGWEIASSTAEGGAGAADTAAVFYTGTAVASKAYATLGYATWETGLATAGTWSAAPDRKQLYGPGVPLPGAVVQQVREQTGAVATGSTQIPSYDTLPQISEGDEYIDLSITPTSAANLLAVSLILRLANSAAAGTNTAALFRDGAANAISAASQTFRGAGDNHGLPIFHQLLAASSSAVAFDVRAGGNTAGTVTLNGSASARQMAGVNNSSLAAQEIMV